MTTGPRPMLDARLNVAAPYRKNVSRPLLVSGQQTTLRY